LPRDGDLVCEGKAKSIQIARGRRRRWRAHQVNGRPRTGRCVPSQRPTPHIGSALPLPMRAGTGSSQSSKSRGTMIEMRRASSAGVRRPMPTICVLLSYARSDARSATNIRSAVPWPSSSTPPGNELAFWEARGIIAPQLARGLWPWRKQARQFTLVERHLISSLNQSNISRAAVALFKEPNDRRMLDIHFG
jgi:hypothetical protein